MSEPLLQQQSYVAFTPSSRVLVTISTPGCAKPISRFRTWNEWNNKITLHQFLDVSLSFQQALSRGTPLAQIEEEMETVLAIGELLASNTYEVVLKHQDSNTKRMVSLEEPAQQLLCEREDENGNTFWTLDLEIRRLTPPISAPEATGIPFPSKISKTNTPALALFEVEEDSKTIPNTPSVRAVEQPAPVLTLLSQSEATPSTAPPHPTPQVTPLPTPVPAQADTHVILSQAEQLEEDHAKHDFLDTKLLPEIEALDFSGLFVGEFGPPILKEQTIKRITLDDLASTAATLQQGDDFFQAGDYLHAFICYQELADLHPLNNDFRLMLEKTLTALQRDTEIHKVFTRVTEVNREGARKKFKVAATPSPTHSGGLSRLASSRRQGNASRASPTKTVIIYSERICIWTWE